MNKRLLTVSVLSLGLILSACDSSTSESKTTTKTEKSVIETSENNEVLPYLNIQEQDAKIALPFCETKNCVDIHIQTVHTVDDWLNHWIEKKQARVVQDQIDSKQDMGLQQAINAYVKQSDAWQAKFDKNKAYNLSMYTRIAYQRNQYVLMQIGVDTNQEEVRVKERYYFFVANRRTQKGLMILDVIQSKQQQYMNKIVQNEYQKWLKTQSNDVQTAAPKKLYWGQADWFFDQEGIGLHYRSNEIAPDSKQLDIYLSPAQTKQVLQADVYQHMF